MNYNIANLEIGTVKTQAQMMNHFTASGGWDGVTCIITELDAWAYKKGFRLVDGGDKDIFVKVKKVVDKLPCKV